MNFFLSVTNVAAAKQVELVCETYHLAKRNLSFRRPKQVELQQRLQTRQHNNNKINTKQAIKSTKSAATMYLRVKPMKMAKQSVPLI